MKCLINKVFANNFFCKMYHVNNTCLSALNKSRVFNVFST